ncbi:DUF3265 domain-containing protein, partial [Vibrio parahaemolyticus]|nr:DUF3265 domain-containing protein [Vibrio parahaemolyticus]
MGLGLNRSFSVGRITKHLSAIHNAWHFWFASNFVIKAQCGSRCVLRCSRL